MANKTTLDQAIESETAIVDAQQDAINDTVNELDELNTDITITLPTGRVTAGHVIAKPHQTTLNIERWFPKSKLKGIKPLGRGKGVQVTLTRRELHNRGLLEIFETDGS